MLRVKEGFTGQKMLVLPDDIISQISRLPLISNLYITNIGYFPNAKHHYVRRKKDFKQYLLIYCLSGQGWYKLNNKYTVRGGQYFILPAGKPHFYGADQNNAWTIYWFHFSGDSAQFIWELYKKRHFPTAKIPFAKQRLDIFNKLYNTLEKGYSDEHIRFTNLTLGHLLNSFLYPNIFAQHQELKESDMVAITIEYMQENLTSSLTLTDLAANANYSVPHFSSEFKTSTGYSPIDYFNRLKIQKACQYLSLTDMRIKEIAFALGFKDAYYFSRLFTNIIGKSPRLYRNENI